jgi:hypothetical protein
MDSSFVNHAISATVSSVFWGGCLFLMGSFLQLQQRQQRPIRSGQQGVSFMLAIQWQ